MTSPLLLGPLRLALGVAGVVGTPLEEIGLGDSAVTFPEDRLPSQQALSFTVPPWREPLARYFGGSHEYRPESLSLQASLDHAEIGAFFDLCGLQVIQETGKTLRILPPSERETYYGRYLAEVASLRGWADCLPGHPGPSNPVAIIWRLQMVRNVQEIIFRRWRHYASAYLRRHRSSLDTATTDLLFKTASRWNPETFVHLRCLCSEQPELRFFLEQSHSLLLTALAFHERTLWEKFQGLARDDPSNIVRVLRDFHRREALLDDVLVDRFLGIEMKDGDTVAEREEELGRQYGVGEQYVYEGTPYDMLRNLLKVLPMKAGDAFYDLGSGYGRVALYAGLTTEARVVGVEIVEDRAARAEAARRRLGLERVQIVAGNVLDQDLSRGSVFFLFNPFSDPTLEEVSRRLRGVAEKKQIRVVSWGLSNDFLLSQSDWLTPRMKVGKRIVVFESVIPQNRRQ